MQLAFKYPFIPSAKKALEGLSEISQEDLESASLLIMDAMRGLAAKKPENSKKHLVSFVVARMLLSACGNYFAWEKFAEWQAKQAVLQLEKNEGERREVVADLLPSFDGDSVSLFDFLSCEGDLASSDLKKGRIFVNGEKIDSLLFSAVRKRVLQKQGGSIPQAVKQFAVEMEVNLPRATETAFAGKYLNQGCVKEIRKGLPEGKRYYGAMALAIACVRDGLPLQEARRVMDEYAQACSKSTHPFTQREAFATLDWAMKRKPRFSCNRLLDDGIISKKCVNCVNG
jgi:hypothetical protein